jgi:inner membrane protein
MSWFATWDATHWLALGLLLLAGELLAPGAFLMWFGLAALVTGVTAFFVPLSFTWQVVVFAVLSVGSVLMVRRRSSELIEPTDQPNLNKRASALIGRTLVLDGALVNGRGRVRVGDGFWTVEGEDLPAGAAVRVQEVKDNLLVVTAER